MEWELETQRNCSLYQAFHHNPVYLQLQFLPLLYADPSDAILVSDNVNLPLTTYTLDDTDFSSVSHVKSWGGSQLIQTWAQRHGMTYNVPNQNVMREVNSKVFSFCNAPPLPGAALLHVEQEALHWLNNTAGNKVLLKTPFRCLGQGDIYWSAIKFPLFSFYIANGNRDMR